MGDVFEYLIDGTSGIVNDNANGKALVAGVCSRGTVGKAYLVGARSDLGSSWAPVLSWTGSATCC